MFRELFSGNSLLDLPVAATVLFFCIFVGAIVWVMRRSQKEHYRRMARMPLDDHDSNDTDPTCRKERGGAR